MTGLADLRAEDGSIATEDLLGPTVSQFLDKGAQRPFDPDATARLATWVAGNDPAIEIGREAALAVEDRLRAYAVVALGFERLVVRPSPAAP